MRMVRVLLIVLCGAFAGGCQRVVSSLAQGGYENVQDSPFYRVPDGSTLVLTQNLIIPPNQVKLFVQDGQIVAAPNRYRPFCRFEVLPLLPTPQTVSADTFLVQRTARVEDLVAATDNRQRYAARSLIRPFDSDGLPTPVVYATRLYLRSASQPEVYRLSCGHLQEPLLGARHLSVNQMRQAMGEIFTLQLALDTQ